MHWPNLTAKHARREWAQLADWISDILVSWYGITRGELPDCWALHRPAVVELSWWRATYTHAYQPRSPATLAAEWHDRWRRVALTNIKAAIPEGQCAPDRHHTSDNEQPTRTLPAQREPSASGSQCQQPAQRAHWNSFYEDAVAADLQWRHGRE
ncbi:MAG: hypothetical protein AB7L91_19460 [Dehalococcoidia bacterium]